MGTYPGLIIIYGAVCLPFSVYLLANFFRTVPSAVMEAGVIDGCSVMQVLTRLVIPLSGPPITTLIIVNALWVAGLGSDALAAVGFFFPFFFMMVAVATGIGMGGGSAVSRMIGANDRKGAENVAAHTLLLTVLISIGVTAITLVLARRVFIALGSGDVTDRSLEYAYPLFISTILIFFTNVANALLRAEGDARRAMRAMLLGTVLNIFLDPLFIYGFGLGVQGASVATVVSIGISSLPLFYWLFMRKDTYVRIRAIRFKVAIAWEILRVGIPSTFQQMSMAVNMLVLVLFASMVGGTDGVAVLSTGWRVATLATMPLMGISTAVMSVTGAAFGARSLEKLKDSFFYAVRFSFIIELGVAIATFALAYPIALAFTHSGSSIELRDDLTDFLRIVCFFYPTVAFGMLSSSMFQGVGRGIDSLVITILRVLILMPAFSLIFAYTFKMGLNGIWLGIVAANVTGAIISFMWAIIFIRRTGKRWGVPSFT
jgi:putative MATE family efflux protein